MTSTKVPASRSPRGVLTKQPITTRLMNDELEAFKTRARKEGRAYSCMARLLIVKGLAADDSQPTQSFVQPHATAVAEG